MDLSNPSILHLLPESDYVCFVVPGLFSPEACAALLDDTLKSSFQQANTHYPTYYRNNDRLVLDDKEQAQYLFDKVKPFLPETIQIYSPNPAEEGIWQLKELNNRLRYCRYQTGQYFHRHLDGVHYRSATVQSKLTFMLYLNDADEFEGGRTLFYQSKETTEIWASYLPKQGDLIVFDHNIWHEGEQLEAGEKFVLRSDILYQRTNEPGPTDTQTPTNYQEGHLGYIWKLLLFDAQTLLSAGRDQTIKIWNTNGECIQRVSGHQNSILCLAKLNETTFLSGSRDQSIKVWQRKSDTFALQQEINIHSAVVLSLCALDENTFASSGGDKQIHICTVTGQRLQTLSGHSDWVWNVIKLTDDVIASCSEDQSIRIWHLKTGKAIATLQENAPVHCLAFDPDTNRLVSGGYSGEIRIRKSDAAFTHWITETTFQAHTGIIRTVELSKKGFLASGGEDNTVRIWDLAHTTLLTEIHHTNFVQSLVITSAHQLISASYDGQIKVSNLSAELVTE